MFTRGRSKWFGGKGKSMRSNKNADVVVATNCINSRGRLNRAFVCTPMT